MPYVIEVECRERHECWSIYDTVPYLSRDICIYLRKDIDFSFSPNGKVVFAIGLCVGLAGVLNREPNMSTKENPLIFSPNSS